ncbi:MAG: hypothetical protein ABI624_18110 [Casimicrobiaceae bacterium]
MDLHLATRTHAIVTSLARSVVVAFGIALMLPALAGWFAPACGTALAQAPSPARSAESVSVPRKSDGPVEVEGRINGIVARFYGDGHAGVVLTPAEADRLGLRYRDAKAQMLLDMPTYPVTLASVQVGSQIVRDVKGLVVPDVAKLFAAVKANPYKAHYESRKGIVQINGKAVDAYDLGMGGLLVPIEEADRIGLRYRDGRKAGEGSATLWMVEVSVRMGDQKEVLMPVTVTDAKQFFSAAQQALEHPPGGRRPP